MSFTLVKNGKRYTVSYAQSDTSTGTTNVFVNGQKAGYFEKKSDYYISKAARPKSRHKKVSTFRMAEQHILDEYFNVFRNSRGVFKKNNNNSAKNT